MPDASIESKRTALILAGVTAAAVCIYLGVSLANFRIGFPLDDAWIHQTYARSFAQSGRWEYFPGQASAGGSTSPLWSLLLAAGYFLKINPYVWTYLLGACFLWGTALLAESTVKHLVTGYHPAIPVIGILFIGEWHLAWASVSGMETSLSILLVTLFFWLLWVAPQKRFLTGLIIGLSIWVRPDGVTLLAPLFIAIVLGAGTYRERFTSLWKSALGFGFLTVPYLLFNLAQAGTLFPNTFYAKQTEYVLLQAVPFYQRFGVLALQPFIGAGFLLIPAILYWLYQAIVRREWAIISGFLWAAMFIGLYAARLPVSYQHGRYEMPVIPVIFLFGSLGGVSWFYETVNPAKNKLIKIVWLLSTASVWILFFFVGARSYAQDVAYIESQMVDTSKWVAVNLPSGALIAAHDIGALGYFGSHQIVDLAGLISPEVIPIMGDQAKIGTFLDGKNVNYLVTFPSWYPDLIKGKTELFSSNSIFATSYGGDIMAVYIWK